MADHLGPGGRLVVELWIPDLRRFPPGAVALPFEVSPTHLGFDEIDTRDAAGCVAPLFRRYGSRHAFRLAVSLRVAGGARPHGAHRRNAFARALERLGPFPVHDESPKHISVCGNGPPDAEVSGRRASRWSGLR